MEYLFCKIAQKEISAHIVFDRPTRPVAYRLYLPKDWADDPVRRRKAGVPEDVGFATNPEIALAQIQAAHAAGLPGRVVLMDAGYGADTALRDGITALGLPYSAGILSTTTVWPQGQVPLPPEPWNGRGRPPTRLRRDAEHQPVAVKALALALPADAWNTVTWRDGSNDDMKSRFARVRVRPAYQDYKRTAPHPEEWLLVECRRARWSRPNIGSRPSPTTSLSPRWSI